MAGPAMKNGKIELGERHITYDDLRSARTLLSWYELFIYPVKRPVCNLPLWYDIHCPHQEAELIRVLHTYVFEAISALLLLGSLFSDSSRRHYSGKFQWPEI